MGDTARFWDRIANRYAKQPIADEAAYAKKLEITRKYFRPDMEALEIGCGTGSTAIQHAPYVRHIRAIDISAKMIEIAQAKTAAKNISNITYDRTAMDNLDVDDQSYDMIMALSFLHLVDNRDDAIHRIYRMLKPGGVFVSSTACLGDAMKYIKLIAPIGRVFGLMPLVRVFTTEELVNSLTGAGFEIDYQWQPGKNKAVFIVAKKYI